MLILMLDYDKKILLDLARINFEFGLHFLMCKCGESCSEKLYRNKKALRAIQGFFLQIIQLNFRNISDDDHDLLWF